VFYPWLASRLTEMQSPLQPTVIRAAGGAGPTFHTATTEI